MEIFLSRGLGSSLIFISSSFIFTSVNTLFFFGGTGRYSLLSMTSNKFRTKGTVAEKSVKRVNLLKLCLRFFHRNIF